MQSTVSWNYFYPLYEANDNALVQAELWQGDEFIGFAPVKGNWKLPKTFKTFNLREI